LEELGSGRGLSSHSLRDGCVVDRSVLRPSDDSIPSLPTCTGAWTTVSSVALVSEEPGTAPPHHPTCPGEHFPGHRPEAHRETRYCAPRPKRFQAASACSSCCATRAGGIRPASVTHGEYGAVDVEAEVRRLSERVGTQWSVDREAPGRPGHRGLFQRALALDPGSVEVQ